MYFTIHNKFEKSKCWRGFFRGKYPEFSTRERGGDRGIRRTPFGGFSWWLPGYFEHNPIMLRVFWP